MLPQIAWPCECMLRQLQGLLIRACAVVDTVVGSSLFSVAANRIGAGVYAQSQVAHTRKCHQEASHPTQICETQPSATFMRNYYHLTAMEAATGLGFSWKAMRATSAMLLHTPLPMDFAPAYTALLSAMPAKVHLVYVRDIQTRAPHSAYVAFPSDMSVETHLLVKGPCRCTCNPI